MRGRRRTSPRARDLALLVGFVGLWAPIAIAETGAGTLQAQTSSNPSSADIIGTLRLPVLVGDATVGSASATVTLTEVLSVSADELADALGEVLRDSGVAAIRSLGPGEATAEAIRSTGIDITFDPSTISLRVSAPPAQRREQVFGVLDRRYDGLERIEPSRFAVGVTGALVSTSRLDRDVSPDTSLSFSGFANVGGAEGLNLLYGGDARLSGGDTGFRRDRLLAFKDDPRRALRFAAGDILPLQARLAGQFDLLGVSIERNYQALQPLRNVRAIGRRSLVLERRSLVEVYVNGALVQSFTAEPGPIDVRDIPLADLSNNVSIVVEDSLGRRELEAFAAGSDLSLLSEGLDEFNLSLGVLRQGTFGDFAYSDDPVVSLFYARGLSQNLTASGHVLLTEDIQNAGGSAAFGAFAGVAFIEGAVSHAADAGAGAAFSLTYRGDPFGQISRDGYLNLKAEVRSREFRDATALGLIESLKFDLAADYRLRVGERTSISFGASYFATHGAAANSRGIFAGVTQGLGHFTASANARYLDREGENAELGAFFTLSMPVGRRGSAYASYDTASERLRAEYRRRRALDYPAVDIALRAQSGRDDGEFGGRLGYETARYGAIADVSQLYRRGGGEDRSVGSLRVQSGLAYVDGRLGIGRDPGQGFVMVSRHSSLRSSPVEVSSGAVGRALGRADAFGPAVIPILAPYRPQDMRINALDLPPGYDIGAGGYVLNPAATSGLSIEVGDAAYRIAVGYLATDEARPITLRAGILRSIDTGEVAPFFTNAEGRVSLNRLAPGRYRIEIEGWTREFDVALGDPALIDLGTLTMAATR